MVDRLYEWHKGDCVDPGPPESVEIKVGVKFRGTRTYSVPKTVNFGRL